MVVDNDHRGPVKNTSHPICSPAFVSAAQSLSTATRLITHALRSPRWLAVLLLAVAVTGASGADVILTWVVKPPATVALGDTISGAANVQPGPNNGSGVWNP